MENKQIIIDGIDVSKCVFVDTENFEKPICHCITQRNERERPCEDNKDCYFKQLARAKQENKKLEKIINKSAERFCNDYLETFKENERLKSELQAKELELIMAKADLCRGCQYKNDYKAKNQECEELINQRDKFEFGNNILEHERNNYKQALDKIEEFCIVYSSNHDTYEMVYKHILGIINKAKDGE